MSKVFSGWTKASVYNPADGTVVQLNYLATEQMSWEEEIIGSDTTNSIAYGGKRYTMRLAFFDGEGYAQLEEWMLNYTPVRIVAAGPVNLQWYEDSTITVSKSISADKRTGLNYFTLEVEHYGSNPAIYTNQNLLAYRGWQDSNNDGIADGWDDIAISNESFTNGTQIFTAGPSNTTNSFFGLYRNETSIQFPISGLTLKKSIINTTIANTAALTIYYRAYDFSVLSTTNITSIPNGLVPTDIIIPVNSFYISLYYGSNTGFTTEVKISNPALTANGKLTSADQFMGY